MITFYNAKTNNNQTRIYLIEREKTFSIVKIEEVVFNNLEIKYRYGDFPSQVGLLKYVTQSSGDGTFLIRSDGKPDRIINSKTIFSISEEDFNRAVSVGALLLTPISKVNLLATTDFREPLEAPYINNAETAIAKILSSKSDPDKMLQDLIGVVYDAIDQESKFNAY